MGLTYTMTQTSPPAVEPVTLSEAKAFLRVDHADEDTLISNLIIAAREAAEHYLQRTLITQSWRMRYEEYAPSVVYLRFPPVQSVSSVKTITRDGTETTISTSVYYLNSNTLYFDSSPVGHFVDITYVAGYGDASSNIPESIRQGLLRHIMGMYDHRGQSEMPVAAQMLYTPYRLMGV